VAVAVETSAAASNYERFIALVNQQQIDSDGSNSSNSDTDGTSYGADGVGRDPDNTSYDSDSAGEVDYPEDEQDVGRRWC
jgi:hypothetical protein